MVTADNLSKTYRVADKQPGMRGTLSHLVRRKYRDIAAVRGVSFTIEPGEVVGFLGANGAGKTTTLKMLSGLMFPSSGRADVLGHEPFQRRHAFLRQITLVMGNKQQLMWDLPAADSYRINAAVYGLSDAEAAARIRKLCDMLGLDQELTQPVRKLSLGQRMKCELVAALLHQPRVLFLDEPTLGLDVNAQASVRKFLRQYNAEHGAAILLTSHYMADITALCDRVVLIHHGKLIYDGRLQALVEQFAPYRQVKLELGHPTERTTLEQYGEVEEHDARTARLLVRREELTTIVGRLLTELPVLDLTVADPPIEDVVGHVFAGGATEDDKPAAAAPATPDVPEQVA